MSPRPSQRIVPERRRLAYALLLSLLLHALLMRLTFDAQGFWLPGFSFPWQDRRTEVPDLRVVVVPAPIAAVEPTSAPTSAPFAAAVAQEEQPKLAAKPRTDAKPRPDAKPGT